MSRIPGAGLRLFAILFALVVPFAASATPDVAAICDSAARVAARESGVPLDVLRAISLTETGRKSQGKVRPWPWTVNMEGVGKWFDDFPSARRYVDRHFARGARSFDVGCFQINYKWHHQGFSSIDEMFDPIANARYAARFLTELYGEFGDWSRAAGAYHSRTPKYARKYTARFDRFRKNLSPVAPEPLHFATYETETPTAAPRVNRYPLLQPGSVRGAGSLVPLDGTRRAPILSVASATPLLGNR